MGEFLAEETCWQLPDGSLRLLRVRNLSRLIDSSALLSGRDVCEPPYWAYLWPAAISLTRLLVEAGAALSGRRVIELGCGLGLPGLVAARCGASVLLTDRSRQALTFARRSAHLNQLSAWFVCMDWRRPALHGRFDLCLAADVSYDTAATEDLVDFLRLHLSKDGEVWIAESVRTEEPGLPEMLRDCFALTDSRIPEMEDGHRVWVRLLRGRRVR